LTLTRKSSRDCLIAVLAAIAMTTASAVSAAESGPCKLAKLDQWSTWANQPWAIVDGSINGRPTGILLDTGSSVSLMTGPAAKRFGFTPFPVKGGRVFGIGGESRWQEVRIEELRVAGHERKNWVALVTGERELNPNVALLLGYDFFRQTDVEFDLANNAIRLFQPVGCDNASLAYWGNGVGELPLEGRGQIEVTVSINGTPLVAWLDSGSTASFLSLNAAARLGITPDSPGVVPGGCVFGIGAQRFDFWIAPFQTFAIGNEVIHNPKIKFAQLWRYTKIEATGSHIPRAVERYPDMLLGGDFLRSHRVLVAHSQGKLYFSYSGGQVFPATVGKTCSAITNYGVAESD
jgi:predicted aspartyl protease